MKKKGRQNKQKETDPDSQQKNMQGKPPIIRPNDPAKICCDQNNSPCKESHPTSNSWSGVVKSIAITDWFIAVATVAIAILTFFYTRYSGKQWQVMEKQTTAAFGQLSTAKATLEDARKSSVEQADRTDKLVKANERISRATIKAANAAKESADIARATLVAENRAWVKLDGTPEIVSPLQFDETGQGNIGIRFKLKNIGRSPALNVWISATCVADISLYMQQPVRDPRKLPECKALRSRKWDIAGDTIFPDLQTYLVGAESLIITKKEIDKRKARLESEGRADSEYVHELAPIIYGCVDYVLSEDGSHHQTGFVYSLYRRDSNGRPSQRLIDTRIPSTPIRQLLLDNYFGSGSYAD